MAGEISTFEDRVLAVLRSLGPGDLVTYGEVAAEAGSPGAARAAGNVVARSGEDVPWWRVVTSTGRLVPGHEREQAMRLRAEGIAVANGRAASSASTTTSKAAGRRSPTSGRGRVP